MRGVAASILIVEDEYAVARGLQYALQQEGYDITVARSGEEGLEIATRAAPDLIVLDVRLPGMDGFEMLRRLKGAGNKAPVLFLTARDALVDRLAGFDAGGDDYLAKPFALAELVARLQALLRRSGSEAAVEAAGLRLDAVTHAVGDGSGTVTLTPTEFRLLARLLARPGEAVRRRDLVRAGWPHGAIVRDNTLDAYVARLRRKLRGLEGAPEIATLHAVGYRIG